MPSEARRSSKSETHDLSATEHLFARRTPSSRPLFVGYCCRSRCVVSSPLCLANINITKGATCASARGPSRLLGSMRIVETIRPTIRRGLDRRIAVTAGDCTIPFVICPKSGCLHGGRSAASSSFVLESGDGQSPVLSHLSGHFHFLPQNLLQMLAKSFVRCYSDALSGGNHKSCRVSICPSSGMTDAMMSKRNADASLP